MNTTVTDCGLHEPFLQVLASSEEESRRVAAQAGLLVLRVVDRFANSDFQTEAESIQYQIAAARKFVSGEVLVLEVRDLLDELLTAAGRVLTTGSTEEIFSPLIDYGRWLEGNLQLDEAIEVYDTLLAVGGTSDNHALVLCWRGRALRIAGKLDISISEYRRAGEIAEATDNRSVQLRSRLGVAMGLKQKGNLPRAEEVARKVVHDARRWGDRHHEAEASHVLGHGLALMGRDLEAIAPLFAAYVLHDREREKARVMSDLGLVMKGLGRYVSALHAFSIALPGLRTVETRTNAVLELMEIESLLGNRRGFEKWRADLNAKMDIMPSDAIADFYIKLGQGLFLLGHPDQGAVSLEQAMSVAEKRGLNTKFFEAERKLAKLKAAPVSTPPDVPPEVSEEAHPEVTRVARQLELIHSGNV
ncbi:MAG: hypothetical protein O7D29_01000 [Gemmatimonadetes bacterium]|nr:hypothetical protein [Gemmatimonadota bacterium]